MIFHMIMTAFGYHHDRILTPDDYFRHQPLASLPTVSL